MNRFATSLVCLLVSGCIGTDIFDDPIVGEAIKVSDERIAIKTGESYQLTAVFCDQYGLPGTDEVSWKTSHANVASVDENGLVQALSVGNAMVVAFLGSTESQAVDVTVVADDQQVASVEIPSQSGMESIMVGQTVQLQAVVKNINGDVLTGRVVEWFSENSNIAAVSSSGLVSGVSMGLVDIHAKSEGVKSNVVHVSVGGGRSGTFVSSGGYVAKGMATLQVANGKLILSLSSDFETSFALGTYVYMANVTNGSQVASSGLEVAQITTNGAKSFDLTAIKADIGINDYNYVVILCKPARVTFGFASLN